MHSDDAREVPLQGGNSSGSVVRVGDTVRKPWLPTTERTVAYLLTLREHGIDVPEPQGRDERGRLVLDYVPGEVALDRAPLDHQLLRRVGELVRRIHDASAALALPHDLTGWEVVIPADGPDLLCHHDLAPWNLVIDGDRLVFIDWDGCGPSTRLWDLAYAALAYAALAFGHLVEGEDPQVAADRLRAFVEGYAAGDDLRSALPTTMARRAAAMHELLRRSHRAGREPWSSMFVEGHGEHWARAAAFIARHAQVWRTALA